MQKKRIICVDDDESILESYKEVFEDLGFEVLLGNNGFDLGCMINESNVAALIVDLSMPGLNGLTAIKRISVGNKSLLPKLVVVSGILDTKVREDLEKLNVQYLRKPVDFDVLVSTVKKITNISS